ncbi:arginase [Cognatishimia maritima]|uniref:Arginase n=1 Tax=Cognatishimia maritima TaxID=870908 RepID=A0A1M5I2L5_9RHOB|nr:arginase [Cognatishimia maritima]SHG22397.1 arginase [Cognatishimia maritima]
MTQQTCILIGAPVDSGKQRRGCLMGPDAYRTAGLVESLEELGHRVIDQGDVTRAEKSLTAPDAKIHYWSETIAWTEALADAAEAAMQKGLPIFLGGDHSLAAGTVTGVARYANAQNRPQFVLWLDAHSDYHTPTSTDSGNLHGTPLAYFTGREGFEGFPKVKQPIPQENVCIIGLRSVDTAEREALMASQIHRHDMREIDESGIAKPLAAFLKRVAEANGLLHVSLDVDFLDPSVAPAVGTTVPGGATVREAHLVMEMLHDSGLMTSLDLVELNPFLDERGRTATLMVDLAASSLGRKIFDRPTRSHL